MAASSGLPTKHSPLGASGASRWMACLGSPQQSEGIVDEESEYAVQGTVAHTVAEVCLVEGIEPWQNIDVPYKEYTKTDDERLVDKEMADAVYDFIEAIEEWHPDRNQGNSWVERRFHCPTIHELCYGTSDFVYLAEQERKLHIWDYKNGAGIVVEAIGNPQGMYYAAGVLEDLMLWDMVDAIIIHIMQPRGWHIDGPHRMWEISVSDLVAWLEDELVPAMDAAMVSRDTVAGPHCRFCPARSHACPSLMEAMEELQELLVMAIDVVDEKKGAKPLTPEQVGRLYDLEQLGKIVFKAAGKTAFGMLSSGIEVPGAKLVPSRTNRQLKKGAAARARKKFGKKAMTSPVLKSPAQIDAMPGGKEFTARYAFKPKGKITVAPEGDPRRRVNRDSKSLFTKKGKKK